MAFFLIRSKLVLAHAYAKIYFDSHCLNLELYLETLKIVNYNFEQMYNIIWLLFSQKFQRIDDFAGFALVSDSKLFEKNLEYLNQDIYVLQKLKLILQKQINCLK